MREGVSYELDCPRACTTSHFCARTALARSRAHRNIAHSLCANARLVIICAFLVLSPERVE